MGVDVSKNEKQQASNRGGRKPDIEPAAPQTEAVTQNEVEGEQRPVKPQEQLKKSTKVSENNATDDAFWLNDLYPDASALFAHDHVALANVLDECIVVLDANVLLWPY